MTRFYAASRVFQGSSSLTSAGSFSEYGLLAAAGAEVFGLLIVLRQGHGVGWEKLAHREGNVAKQAAGIVGATAGALLLRHTVVIHRHQPLGKEIGTGTFGADMKVELLNNGPVTICMDTKNKE